MLKVIKYVLCSLFLLNQYGFPPDTSACLPHKPWTSPIIINHPSLFGGVNLTFKAGLSQRKKAS
jgi:hypothetical protein